METKIFNSSSLLAIAVCFTLISTILPTAGIYDGVPSLSKGIGDERPSLVGISDELPSLAKGIGDNLSGLAGIDDGPHRSLCGIGDGMPSLVSYITLPLASGGDGFSDIGVISQAILLLWGGNSICHFPAGGR